MRFRLLTFFALVATLSVVAETVEKSDSVVLRPVTSSYELSFGGAELADTYLTPLIYRGESFSFLYDRMQAMKFSPEKWVMELMIGLEGSRTKNPAGNSTMWEAGLSASWSMMRRWHLDDKWTIGVGGFTGLDVGALYLKRNGNNPASAKASWTVGVKSYLTFKFGMGKVPVLLRWSGSMPLGGIFFSPDYGELYYEIWLGNHSGLVHGAWPGDYLRIDNTVSMDFGFGSTWLRVGYRSHILSTKVNDITSRMVTNSFVLGISGEWISVRPNKPIGNVARVISALY